MLKHLSICAALVALGIGPLHAQKQEAILQHVDVPGAGFDFVLAVPKSDTRTLRDLGNTPDALVAHLHDGKLVVVFDDAREMIRTMDLLRSPACAVPVGGPGPVALYTVPKRRAGAPAGHAGGVEAAADQCFLVLVPGSDSTAPIRRAQADTN